MIERLKTRRDFRAVARGARLARPAFVVEVLRRGDEGPPRVGFTVSRRAAAKAVERNRIRRRLKEAVRRAASAARPGHDYVLIGRTEALTADFAQMAADIATAMQEGPAKAGTRAKRRPAEFRR
jgi:ribonuclease P protein component